MESSQPGLRPSIYYSTSDVIPPSSRAYLPIKQTLPNQNKSKDKHELDSNTKEICKICLINISETKGCNICKNKHNVCLGCILEYSKDKCFLSCFCNEIVSFYN